MLDAAQEAIGYARLRSRIDLDTHRMRMHSLVRCIEIVGEAANQVSEETRSAVPGIPWRPVIGNGG